MTISDKIFSYIDTGQELTQSMIDNYKNSLIFIGDEQQIFNPLTGAYVGIGMTYFNQVREEILSSTDMTKHLDKHIHQNVVNSLWIEYNEDQFDSVFTEASIPSKIIGGNRLSQGDGYQLKTNQDIIVKGLHDYDKTTGRAKTTDDIGWLIHDTVNNSNINNTLWKHITLGTYGSSGITVNFHHTDPGTYRVGVDTYGFAYSYFEGQDYITIDDHLTWSYIAEQTSYLMGFSKKMAVQQANRIYHDILGGNNAVYVEKSFNEVFTFDNYSDLTQLVEGELGQVYIHTIDANNPAGIYPKVYIYNDPTSDKYYICAQNDNANQFWVIKTNDSNLPASITVPVYDPLSNTTINKTAVFPTPDNLKNWLFPDDGYDKLPNGEWNVAWYHVDAEATAQGQLNLADGIQTFKEVAYILDRITDGNDNDPINLTYNIVQNHNDIELIKSWQQSLGDNVLTSIEGTSANKFIVLNSYSTNQYEDTTTHAVRGDAKIDINLRLAQTYVLNGSTYAAYLYSNHANQTAPIWIELGDTTYIPYYLEPSKNSVNKTTLQQNLTEIFGSSASISIYKNTTYDINNPDFQKTTTSVQISNITSRTWADGEYVLFNYKKLDNSDLQIPATNILDGITTVSWVTTYFRWAEEDILNIVDTKDNTVKDWVQQYIDGMNTTDSAITGQFVTRVQQVNGKIEVTRQRLPLDTIIHSPEIYGDDFFVAISEDQAEQLLDANNPNPVQVYHYANNRYSVISWQSGLSNYYIRARITKFTPIDLSNIDAPNGLGLKTITNELLANGGHVTYFLNTSAKVVDRDVAIDGAGADPVNVIELVPVDIHELLTNSPYDDYIDRATLTKLSYYNDSLVPLTKSSKYFDAQYRQRTDGGTEISVSTYITYLGSSSSTNTGLADAWDVRHTIESMFTWINLKTNKRIDEEHGLNMIFIEPENG